MEGISRIPLTLALLSHWLTWHRAYSAPSLHSQRSQSLYLWATQPFCIHSANSTAHSAFKISLPRLQRMMNEPSHFNLKVKASVSFELLPPKGQDTNECFNIYFKLWCFCNTPFSMATTYSAVLYQQSLILLRKIKKRKREEGGEVRSPQFGCYSRGSPCWNDLELLKGALLAFLKVEAVLWSRYGFSEHQSSSL